MEKERGVLLVVVTFGLEEEKIQIPGFTRSPQLEQILAGSH